MNYTTLGRSGIRASVLGIGAGGPSRIGKSLGIDEKDSADLVRKAYDMGINCFDTAESYGTEEIIGNALAGVPSDQLCLATKCSTTIDGRLKDPKEIERSLDASLLKLKRDYVDVYFLHAVMADRYEEIRENAFPILERLKQKGKLRAIGITEMFGKDPGHVMLNRAVAEDLWDVIMIGMNVLNFSARPILNRCVEKEIGVFDMFAVRRTLRNLETVSARLIELTEQGLIDGEAVRRERPFSYALEIGEVGSVPEMAYRFCLHEPGMSVVLSGTSSLDHLRENKTSSELGPLSAELRRRLEAVFGNINPISEK
ncbi:MAG: aldo/keto reductase [Spirochaetales bacterium]|jgi:L-galactose dehydrogenase|nr:aldo/keto reductase [Spirochaetales bacterium]